MKLDLTGLCAWSSNEIGFQCYESWKSADRQQLKNKTEWRGKKQSRELT